ncbi:NADH dehydrogenase [ubiquinone] 1 beta subcomplex subunit 8, mitochondrial [Prorops nasuta]|uniref:NADH dehydrogenase [ubiquinone] 1 beta subcomplex subunit 8, mitochondrial n=1 Tax=Prorops nasuta TaxID=863751 RepID=UPI0034CFCB5A
MANVLRFYKLSELLLKRPIYVKNHRTYAKYTKRPHPLFGTWDLSAQEVPKYEAERKAAAAKYNLHPDEYETYPEDYAYGDYPKLPDQGLDARDPYYPWDEPYQRRMKSDPMHIYETLFTLDRHSQYNVDDHLYTPSQGTIVCLLFFSAVFALYYLTFNYRLCPPVAEKQYPKAGVAHYTFEPAV